MSDKERGITVTFSRPDLSQFDGYRLNLNDIPSHMGFIRLHPTDPTGIADVKRTYASAYVLNQFVQPTVEEYFRRMLAMHYDAFCEMSGYPFHIAWDGIQKVGHETSTTFKGSQ